MALNIPLINLDVELILTWTKNCVLVYTKVNEGVNLATVAPSSTTVKITNTKLYVPAVTLLKENNAELLEKIKSGFKRTIKWKNYRSQITI